MKLGELRKLAGLKQSELAALSGVNLRSLQDYEQGHKSLLSAKGETLLLLSKGLGCSIEDMLSGYVVSVEDPNVSKEMMARRLLAYKNALEKRKAEKSSTVMSKNLSRAKVALENAEHNYRKIQFDECYMEACCFYLEQSIEFSLKFLVEMTGQLYAENHDIRANINILNRVDYHVSFEKELRNMASTLYSWETESRYKDSFVAVVEDVEEAFTYARALLNEAASKIS